MTRGIRGELNVVVKMEYFKDVNKFGESSLGVRFFSRSSFPDGFQVHRRLFQPHSHKRGG